MMSSLEWNMGGWVEETQHDGEEIPESYSWETRFTYTSSKVGDRWLVYGISTDVETDVFDEEGSIEAQKEMFGEVPSNDLMNDDR